MRNLRLAMLGVFLLSALALGDSTQPTVSQYVMKSEDNVFAQSKGPASNSEFPVSDHYELRPEVIYEQKDREDSQPREMGRQRLEPTYHINEEEIQPATEEILSEFKDIHADYYDRYPCNGASCTATLSVEMRDYEDHSPPPTPDLED